MKNSSFCFDDPLIAPRLSGLRWLLLALLIISRSRERWRLDELAGPESEWQCRR